MRTRLGGILTGAPRVGNEEVKIIVVHGVQPLRGRGGGSWHVVRNLGFVCGSRGAHWQQMSGGVKAIDPMKITQPAKMGPWGQKEGILTRTN